MSVKNKNSYDVELFRKSFSSDPIYQLLLNDFDELIFENSIPAQFRPTPRQLYGDKSGITIFSTVSFYYLKYLTNRNPKVIYDIGCGWNIFKKYIPTIIGIGAETPGDLFFYADIHGQVNDDFVENHQDFFESAFSICALHFHPLSNIRKVVTDFVSMLQHNGIGYLALNLARMIEKDIKFTNVPYDKIISFVRDELDNVDFNYLVFDLLEDKDLRDSPLDGNLRIVCHKIT
jgi:hypothetical protein